MQFNKVIILANLTRDPELTYTPQGKAVAKFGIACNEGKDKVSFFEVVAWEKTAELCSQYLTKGSGLLIEGKLHQNRWETENGDKRSKVEIIANNVQFMPKRGEVAAEEADVIGEGDIPF